MEEFIAHHSWLALFVVSFLAATLLPLGSEWLLAALVAGGAEPVAAVAVATAGNSLGACTTYAIGIWGGSWVIRKVLRIDEHQQRRAETFYRRYGCWSLLLAWLPVVGDPLCLVGGLLRVRFMLFLLLVAIGKFGRYAIVAWAALQAAS